MNRLLLRIAIWAKIDALGTTMERATSGALIAWGVCIYLDTEKALGLSHCSLPVLPPLLENNYTSHALSSHAPNVLARVLGVSKATIARIEPTKVEA